MLFLLAVRMMMAASILAAFASNMAASRPFDKAVLFGWVIRDKRPMRKPELGEMNAFVTVAERRSFANAAVQLGISRSRLSETIRGPRGQAWRAPPQPDDTQRGADGCR